MKLEADIFTPAPPTLPFTTQTLHFYLKSWHSLTWAFIRWGNHEGNYSHIPNGLVNECQLLCTRHPPPPTPCPSPTHSGYMTFPWTKKKTQKQVRDMYQQSTLIPPPSPLRGVCLIRVLTVPFISLCVVVIGILHGSGHCKHVCVRLLELAACISSHGRRGPLCRLPL